VATPLIAAATRGDLRAEDNEVVSVLAPGMLIAIGLWCEKFAQTTDGEIQMLLDRAWHLRAAAQRAEPDAHAPLSPACVVEGRRLAPVAVRVPAQRIASNRSLERTCRSASAPVRETGDARQAPKRV
jgi:hypothetical protein